MATLTTSAPAPVAGTLPRARRGVGDGLLRQAILVALVGSSVGAHLASAASASGVMAWMMAGMGMACASCLIHLWRGTCAVRTAARHLLVMCAVMALFHMAWLTFPGGGGHHDHGGGAPATGSPAENVEHGSSMLGVIAVELLCLAGATALLRTGNGARRRGPTETSRHLEAAPNQVNTEGA